MKERWNALKLNIELFNTQDRKQDLNGLYQVCGIFARSVNKMAAMATPSKYWHILLRCTIYMWPFGPLV